jgi:ABC-type transport system involved in cytochrome c biogenesis permease subunit
MLKLSSFFVTLIILLSSCTPVWGQMNFCTSELESYPTRQGGREKPLYVLASETLKFISGETKFAELSATEAFCKLSLSAFGMPLALSLPVKVEHVEVKKLLGLKDSEASILAQDLGDKMPLIETELQALKENNSYKKELNKVKQRHDAYRAIVEARLWTVPLLVEGDKIDFITLGEFLTPQKVEAAREKSSNPVNYLFEEAKAQYLKIKGEHYLWELKYFKWNLFGWAIGVSLLSIILLVALKSKWPGALLAALSILMQITGMIMRIVISGRAPVTNMYETVMFSGLGALLIASLITLYRREIAFLVAGLAYDVLCLMMMRFAHGMLDPGISPLVPVLRDNFWLSTHVTTVILSYAALALSWIIANGLLIRERFLGISSAEYRYGVDLIYTCIKYGVILLSAGIILGGVWADYSWGRFWGWDPKETWSLIVLLVYMAILHGKYTSWIPPQRFVPLVAGAFMSVMMAWFGVNYILATGLHSYGFSEGGAIFLGSFFALQCVLLVVGVVGRRKI